MAERLYRNPGPDQTNFTGAVPGVLEISFSGQALPGSPGLAQIGTDLYSVVLHEMGHAIGMSNQLISGQNQIADNDFDVNPALVNGNVFQLGFGGATGAHTTARSA